MVVPEGYEASQQIRPAQNGAVGRSVPADHDMVAPAGAGVASVDHEFFGAQAVFTGCFVQFGGAADHFPPVVHGLDVHLDHPGVGGDLQAVDTRIERRRIAFHHHRELCFFGGGLHGGRQLQISLQGTDRRHEDIQLAVPRLHAKGRSNHPAGGLPGDRLRIFERGRLGADSVARSFDLSPGQRPLPTVQVRQWTALDHRVCRVVEGKILFRHPGKRLQGQPQTGRRIAGEQKHVVAPERPRAAFP